MAGREIARALGGRRSRIARFPPLEGSRRSTGSDSHATPGTFSTAISRGRRILMGSRATRPLLMTDGELLHRTGSRDCGLDSIPGVTLCLDDSGMFRIGRCWVACAGNSRIGWSAAEFRPGWDAVIRGTGDPSSLRCISVGVFRWMDSGEGDSPAPARGCEFRLPLRQAPKVGLHGSRSRRAPERGRRRGDQRGWDGGHRDFGRPDSGRR